MPKKSKRKRRLEKLKKKKLSFVKKENFAPVKTEPHKNSEIEYKPIQSQKKTKIKKSTIREKQAEKQEKSKKDIKDILLEKDILFVLTLTAIFTASFFVLRFADQKYNIFIKMGSKFAEIFGLQI